MQTILVTGGTGLIGKALTALLQSKGYSVLHLSRRDNPRAAVPAYAWDIAKGYIDPEALERADGIVHLAGAGIADSRWTAARKRELYDSRVLGTRLLTEQILRASKRPRVFVCGSAIGYYGNRGDEILTEESAAGNGFMTDICRDWEAAIEPLRAQGLRCPVLRIGIVLSDRGGALAKMLPSYRFRLGAYFGNGKQYYSWVHIDDICRMLLFLLEQPHADGVYNGTAPNPVPNAEFARSLARALQRPSLIVPVPAFALRLAMGEMADVVLHGCRVLPQRLQSAGYTFVHPDLEPALAGFKP